MKDSEYDLCKKFFYQVECLLFYKQVKPFIIFHVANERIVDKNRAAPYFQRLKAMGFKYGVPDYILTTKDKSVYIEFKRDAKAKLSDHQSKFKFECDALEIPYLLTYDVNEAVDFVIKHFSK